MASRKAKDIKAADNEFQYANATPIQIWRSDGTEMPSEYSQYEKVEEGAKPIIEWQNKLGQALAAELMAGATGLYFLQDFPSHYHLRWYQAKEDKKKHQAKHYYLFGYPEEPSASKARKYYRSPNHFLPHLLWLIGESQDRGDCALAKEEADIRPFLAFSIPQINAVLLDFKGKALAEINWQGLQDRFGTQADASRREGLAIEATKLAATRVDQCYSTFNPIQEVVQNYDVFGGIFLGAEKICAGEAVRIQLAREQQEHAAEKGLPVVMVVKRILISRLDGTLVFEGSLWKLQHTPLTQQPRASNQPQLPTAMLGEKEFRDGILQSRGWSVEWVLANQNMSVDESVIRGRFYETRRLTPILNPAKFEEMLHQKHVDDIQTLLNNRGDSNSPRVGRVLNRAQAVAGAVPAGVFHSLGPDVIEA
ncbi:hypothetical protein ONZ43_g1600 [Nemania bipapillata]|uniref:Uncharacterized protein n=1 Tax=Nemania bipapillata TaxID=110536 RepID=A0ACC2J459_9PEZI|nr:hypothetical protein ONZ43_g1600 [Nemania bipapillata]